MQLIYEKSQAGRRAGRLPDYGLPVPEVPASLARKEPPRLPELAENEIVRHFTNLADRNFGIDTGFYPLGSCTMKYNPRVNERVVSLAGLRATAPASGGRGRAGRARADVGAAADPRRGGRPARGDAAAGRRLAGGADGADADARRTSRTAARASSATRSSPPTPPTARTRRA